MRTTPSGLLIAQGSDQSLKIVDKKLTEKHKFKSQITPRSLSNSHFLKPNFSFEGGKTIWFADFNSISIVDLRTLDQTLIRDIIPQLENSTPQPISVIADFSKDKILILCELEGEKMLSYYEPRFERPMVRLIGDIFPKVTKANCLELSSGQKIAYLGCSKKFKDQSKSDKKSIHDGTTHSNKERACLVAFKFDSGLEKVSEFFFQDNDDCTEILSLKLVKIQSYVSKFGREDPLSIASERKVNEETISLIYVLTNFYIHIILHDMVENKFQQVSRITWKYHFKELENVIFREFTVHQTSIFLTNFENEPSVLKISFGEEIVARRSTYRQQANAATEPIEPNVQVMKLNLQSL